VNIPLNVPVDIGRDQAAAAARRELSKAIYQQGQPSLLERIVGWVLNRIESALSVVGVSAGVGVVGAIVLVALVGGLIAWRVGPVRRVSGPGEHAVFVGRPRSAAEYRQGAEAAAARGAWDEAVREQFRAIVRALEERDILDVRAGRTADEAAAEAGRALPDRASELRRIAVRFDDIVYGGAAADSQSYQEMRALDEHLRRSRPMLAPELVR
jgi:hypothetical protein